MFTPPAPASPGSLGSPSGSPQLPPININAAASAGPAGQTAGRSDVAAAPHLLPPLSPANQTRRRLPAAALIPLRIRDKQVEVLIGQIEVLDGVTSTPGGGMQVNPFPGEHRLPARQHRSTTGSPNTPLETYAHKQAIHPFACVL